MNDFFFITAVSWDTRNWRHDKKAVESCKNYGLRPLARTFYAGKLKKKERNELSKILQTTFIKKTEKFYLLPLCKSCYKNSELHISNNDRLHDAADFEITT